MKPTKRPFGTSSFYLAAFLYSRGAELLALDRKNARRTEFIFRYSVELEAAVRDFNFAPENANGVMVDARKLVYAVKTLKDKLYQS